MKKHIILLIFGMLLILVGALLKINNSEHASTLISIGLIAELSAGILFFLNRNNSDAKYQGS